MDNPVVGASWADHFFSFFAGLEIPDMNKHGRCHKPFTVRQKANSVDGTLVWAEPLDFTTGL